MSEPAGPLPELLTPHEAGRILGVRPKHMTRVAQKYRLRVYRTIGGHRRFVAAEVEALAEKLARAEVPRG